MNFQRTNTFKNKKEGNQLLSRVLNIFLAHQIDMQTLNGLRYECMRQARAQFITCSLFLKTQKSYGVCLKTAEAKDFYDMLSLGAPKGFFNLDQLTKVLQVVAKLQY